MKLFFVLENAKRVGGGDYCIFKYAQFLAKRGHEVTLYAKNKSAFFDNENFPATFRILCRGALQKHFKGYELVNKFYAFLYELIIIKPLIKKEKPDYLVGYLRDSSSKVRLLSKQLGISALHFVFESPPWMEKDLKERWHEEYQGKFRKSWESAKQAYMDADVLLGISAKSQKECEKWTSHKVLGYVYPGLDKREMDKIAAKKKNQIIYVGRLNAYKNIDDLIRALSLVKNALPLIIVGGGEEKDNLEKLAKELKVSVRFVIEANDTQKYKEIASSQFMVFPTSHEGFGMPPMEALYLKVPCICSDKEIFKEIYEDKVDYFRERDVQDLKRVIEKMLASPSYRDRRGLKGHQYVKKKFDWAIAAKQIEGFLSK